MSKKHTYVLGLNTYDHDVSACLLRDGAIAFAIAIVYQPNGWVVFVGLAAFQLLVMSTVFGGLIREVRRA